MKCSFCRNDNATNEHKYQGDFVFFMCDDCNSRYKDNKQLGPKFVVCNCDPKNPKELSLEMAQSEILQNAIENVSSGPSKGDNYERFMIKGSDKKDNEVSKMQGKKRRNLSTGY